MPKKHLCRGEARYERMRGPPCVDVIKLGFIRSKPNNFINGLGKKWGGAALVVVEVNQIFKWFEKKLPLPENVYCNLTR